MIPLNDFTECKQYLIDSCSFDFFIILQIGFGMLSGAESWPKSCPTAYAQHLATIDDHCEIHYCVRTHVFDRPPPLALKRPPYGLDAPKLSNYTVFTNVIISPSGQVWKRNSTEAKWTPIDYSFGFSQLQVNASDLDAALPNMESLENSSLVSSKLSDAITIRPTTRTATESDLDGTKGTVRHGYSGGEVTGIAIGCAVGAVFLTVVILAFRRRDSKRSHPPLSASGNGVHYDGLAVNTQQQDTA